MSEPPEGTEPQWSADRQWWWTGSEWVPASQGPSPAAPPHIPASPTNELALVAAAKSRPNNGWRWARWWSVAIGLVLCVPVGLVLTWLTSWRRPTKIIVTAVTVLAYAGLILAVVMAPPAPKQSPTIAAAISPRPSSTPRVSVSASATPSALPPSNASPVVTGYGATITVWAANHVKDTNPKLDAGCCWNPDPNLQLGGPGTKDDYVNLGTDNNIVDSYEMLFNYPGTSIAEAQAAAVRELPSDAKVAFFVTGSMCAVLELTSQTLVPILVGDTNGSVDFQFQSANADLSGFVYDPNNVEVADVTEGLGKVSARGCK
jgi:hypothetical protein